MHLIMCITKNICFSFKMGFKKELWNILRRGIASHNSYKGEIIGTAVNKSSSDYVVRLLLL